MWDSMSENGDYCQCSSMGKSGCGVSQQCSSYLDKENMQGCLGSPMKQDADLSLYESTSPVPIQCDASPTCLRQIKVHPPLEDNDNNSQDSGYGASCPNERSKLFSPKTQPSFSSMGSMDDDFLDICGLEDDDENAQLPGDFNKLITGSLLSTHNKKSPETFVRTNYRRAISEISSTPSITRVRSCLFKQSDKTDVRSFKRPEPPTDICSPSHIKRSRIFDDDQENIKPTFTRSLSLTANEDSIKSALQRSLNEPDLIGDFSKSFCLPLIDGRHPDLKSITPVTLALLIKGQFNHRVGSFKIIDCRYPYEYDGGHIASAINLYTKQQIMDNLLEPKVAETQGQDNQSDKRHILVFHCEFSSERGPNLSRFLRQTDRKQNKDFYPFLHFPEVYLLEGGYKKFFEQHPGLCAPEAYLPMLHPKHDGDLRHFRAKSKTFNNDFRLKTTTRSSSFKRI